MSDTPLADKLQDVRTFLVQATATNLPNTAKHLAKEALDALGHVPQNVAKMESTLAGAMQLVKESATALKDFPNETDIKVVWEDEKPPTAEDPEPKKIISKSVKKRMGFTGRK